MNIKQSLFLNILVLLTFNGCWNNSKNNASKSQAGTSKAAESTQEVNEAAKSVMQITTEQQFEEIIKSDKTTVIKLDAPWCSACKYLQPHLVDAANKAPEFVFAQVNIDQLAKIGQQYKIVGIPTLLFFKDGKEIADSRIVGPDATSGDQLLTIIRNAVKK